jgi:hypothetical protein
MASRVTRRRLFAAAAASAAALTVPRSTWAGEAAPAAAFQFVEQEGGRLHLAEADKPVLAYCWGDQLKEGAPANFKRSCYVHPVFGLDGEELTDDFPKDHYHHRGVSWMWPRMKVAGRGAERDIDLWAVKGIRQHFVKWLERRADAAAATVAVENSWVIDGPPVAKETVRLTAHKAGAAGRAIDVELRFEALSGPIEIRGEITKGYGGLCFRFAPREDTVITTPAGKQDKDSDHLKFPWADLSARFAGRTEMSGAAVFIHPANPAAPNEWTLRHYGFLGPCWPGMETVTLEPGKPVTLRYRLWIHRGDAAAGRVAAAYDAYRNLEPGAR